MNKKIIAIVVAISLTQAPQAQAGFFDSLKGKLAIIGIALAGLFALRSPPRHSTTGMSD